MSTAGPLSDPGNAPGTTAGVARGLSMTGI